MSLLASNETTLLLPTDIQPEDTDYRQKWKRFISVPLILGVVMLERLAFYAMSSNLSYLLVLDSNDWKYPNTLILSSIFIGISHISALFSAWISDGKLGRAKTIIIGYIFYIIGYLLVSLLFVTKSDDEHLIGNSEFLIRTTAQPPFFSLDRIGYFLGFLFITGIGVGSVQANCAVFGAEQVQSDSSEGVSYFYLYYGAVNLGAAIGYSFSPFSIDDGKNILPFLGALVLSFILFCAGYRCYFHVKSDDSVFGSFLPQLCNGCSVWISKMFSRKNQVKNPEYKFEKIQNPKFGKSESWLIDYARESHGGRYFPRQVKETKQSLRITLLFILMIPYWLIAVQPDTTFIVQGTHMKLPSYKVKSILWFSLPDSLIIIVIVISFSLIICFFGRRIHFKLSLDRRLIIGFVFASLSMVSAGLVEVVRQRNQTEIDQTIGNITYEATDINIFVQFIQYSLVAIAEIFASIASLELAFVKAPKSAISLAFSLQFFFRGVASFFISIVVAVVQSHSSSDKEEEDTKAPIFYAYFFSLALLQLFGIILFVLFKKKTKLFNDSYRQTPNLSFR